MIQDFRFVSFIAVLFSNAFAAAHFNVKQPDGCYVL